VNGLQLLWTQAWRKTRVFILERDGYVCQIRGPHCEGYASQVDHVIARHEGGAMFDPSNLRAACAKCNGGRRTDRNTTATRHRLPVPTNDTRPRTW
jgi:5-methylcytosine-specific restriction endonuclease McrA